MKEKLKRAIIHFLGGYTAYEAMELESESYCRGFDNLALGIKEYMESINGTSADEWCKKVYGYICKCKCSCC